MFFEILVILMLASSVIWGLMTLLNIAKEIPSQAFKSIQSALFYFSIWPFMLVIGIILMITVKVNEAKKRRRYERNDKNL
jgi:heme/copper-type cytochrome/quinol oxidase subunit 2